MADPAPRPVTVITGASAGIGVELARIFAARGHELMLVARREAALQALAGEIASGGGVAPHVLPLDLARTGSAERIGAELAARGLAVQFIVNNAGFGLVGRAADLERAEQLAMVDVNVRALTELSLAFTESLARYRGGILNVASVAAFLPGPGMAVYYASKAYVLSFTEALHRELAPCGIRVTVLCPGPVPTEFQARAGVPDHLGPSLLERDAREVALAGYRGLMAGRRIVVPGWPNALVTRIPRLLPRGLVVRIMERVQMRRFGVHTRR
jgi:short-subunit dehydrogenase